jgi:hypothetical protein
MVVPEKTEGSFGMFFPFLFVAASHLPRSPPVQDLVPFPLAMQNKCYFINIENIMVEVVYYKLLFKKITH